MPFEGLARCRAASALRSGAFSSGNPSGGWLYNPFNFSVKNVANTGEHPSSLLAIGAIMDLKTPRLQKMQ